MASKKISLTKPKYQQIAVDVAEKNCRRQITCWR